MYCPKCKAEYREGFSKCSECDIELVKELPIDSVEDDNLLVDISVALQQSDIGFIKSILDAENITYKIFDESSGNLFPVPDTNRLMVAKKDQQIAMELLKDFL